MLLIAKWTTIKLARCAQTWLLVSLVTPWSMCRRPPPSTTSFSAILALCRAFDARFHCNSHHPCHQHRYVHDWWYFHITIIFIVFLSLWCSHMPPPPSLWTFGSNFLWTLWNLRKRVLRQLTKKGAIWLPVCLLEPSQSAKLVFEGFGIEDCNFWITQGWYSWLSKV